MIGFLSSKFAKNKSILKRLVRRFSPKRSNVEIKNLQPSQLLTQHLYHTPQVSTISQKNQFQSSDVTDAERIKLCSILVKQLLLCHAS